MSLKKCMKKIVPLFLGIVMCSSSLVYGADVVDDRPLLTLDSAIRSAIERSNQIKVTKQESSVLDLEMTVASVNEQWETYDTARLNQNNISRMVGILQDRIKYQVESAFYKIAVLEQEKLLMEKQIKIKEKDVEVSEIKNKKGLVNPITHQATIDELTTLKNDLAIKVSEIEKEKNNLGTLIGENINRFRLENTIKYEPFKIVGLTDAYIKSKLDTVLWYNEELLKVKEDNLIGQLLDPQYYVRNRYEYIKGTYNLEEKEKEYIQQLRTTYQTLLDTEEKINKLNAQVGLTDKNLKVSEKYYDAGKISKLEYEKKLLEKEQLELQINQLKSSYFDLKMTLQQPWIAFQ